MRNRFWLGQIETVRHKNPNAVLIVYAGSEHLSYYAPFSVGVRLPAEETFSAHVFEKRNAPMATLDFFDLLGDRKYPFYKEKVLS